jgi:hypothetical protein
MKVSERRVCRALGQHRSTQRRLPKGRADEERLVADISVNPPEGLQRNAAKVGRRVQSKLKKIEGELMVAELFPITK